MRILAIIPCYNEAASIAPLLQEFAALDVPCDTLVIDDGSTDGTYDAAAPFTRVIRFDKHRGLPVALKEGIRFALEQGYDLCVQIDGDGQHVPQEIPALISAYAQAPAHLLIGNRYGKNDSAYPNAARRAAAFVIALAIYGLFGRRFTDATSGMRMMDKTAMKFFAQHLCTRYPDTVLAAQALAARLSVREVPVRMRARRMGRSFLSATNGLWFTGRVLAAILCLRFSRSD